MLQILRALFSAERGLAYFFDVTFAICIACVYETHKRQKAGLKNPAYFIF